jgi:PAS domain S-box-containing protein
MEALRESQQLLNKTFGSLRDAVLILSAETRIILDCNPAATKLFGYSREEIVGKDTRFLHVDETAFDEFGDLARASFREKGYLHLANFCMQRKNGEVFPTRHSVMPLQAEDGSAGGWVSVIRDVTEEKRAEEKLEQYRRKLRALAAELIAVEARERRSVAAQLHENLGQLLATAKMKVAALRSSPPDDSFPPRVAEVQGLVEEALVQTRSLTYELSPPILYQLGLEAALKWLCESMQQRYGYAVAFTRQGESGALPEAGNVFLFSAVRELLVNVAKHAAATQVAVRLHWQEYQVEVLVRDNGKGFQRTGLDLPESKDGFGLFNIQERASDLGGKLWVRSEPRKGTAARIHLPLDQAAGSSTLTDVQNEHTNSLG